MVGLSVNMFDIIFLPPTCPPPLFTHVIDIVAISCWGFNGSRWGSNSNYSALFYHIVQY